MIELKKILFITLILFAGIFLFGCINPPVCGNDVCEAGETPQNCPISNGGDCPPISEFHSVCQNNACVQVSGLGLNECSADVNCINQEPVCGNGVCDVPDENNQVCPQDCNVQTFSGCKGEIINGLCYGVVNENCDFASNSKIHAEVILPERNLEDKTVFSFSLKIKNLGGNKIDLVFDEGVSPDSGKTIVKPYLVGRNGFHQEVVSKPVSDELYPNEEKVFTWGMKTIYEGTDQWGYIFRGYDPARFIITSPGETVDGSLFVSACGFFVYDANNITCSIDGLKFSGPGLCINDVFYPNFECVPGQRKVEINRATASGYLKYLCDSDGQWVSEDKVFPNKKIIFNVVPLIVDRNTIPVGGHPPEIPDYNESKTEQFLSKLFDLYQKWLDKESIKKIDSKSLVVEYVLHEPWNVDYNMVQIGSPDIISMANEKIGTEFMLIDDGNPNNLASVFDYNQRMLFLVDYGAALYSNPGFSTVLPLKAIESTPEEQLTALVHENMHTIANCTDIYVDQFRPGNHLQSNNCIMSQWEDYTGKLNILDEIEVCGCTTRLGFDDVDYNNKIDILEDYHQPYFFSCTEKGGFCFDGKNPSLCPQEPALDLYCPLRGQRCCLSN